MKHLFVSYEIAKLLKDKGFDEECLYYYFPTGIVGETIYKLLSKEHEVDLDGTSIDKGYKLGLFQLTVPAPLYQQVIDWFREKHGLHIWAEPMGDINPELYTWYIESTKGIVLQEVGSPKYKNWEWSNESYYQALDAAIKEALKLI